MVRRIVGFLAIVVVMAALVAAAGSQVTLNALGVPVTLADRLRSAGTDIVGFGPTLVLFLAPFALVTFLIAGLALRFTLFRRILLFGGAGALALLGMVFALSVAFPMPVLAAARTGGGVAMLSAAAALGGALYALVGPRSKLTG
ncbi:MAG: hypothetical protein ACOYKM_08490 [Caulobacterales bacterium]|jgi:hypothetical protein